MNNEPDYKDNLAFEPEMNYREFNFWCRTLEGVFTDLTPDFCLLLVKDRDISIWINKDKSIQINNCQKIKLKSFEAIKNVVQQLILALE